MHGSSTTLQQIGYMQYLETGTHGWNDLHTVITKENDPAKRAALRNQSVSSDYYLGSVHALTERGEFLIASNTGSQLPHIAFTSPNLIFVVGTQKIVPSLMDGMRRLEDIAQSESTKAYGNSATINIIERRESNAERRIHFFWSISRSAINASLCLWRGVFLLLWRPYNPLSDDDTCRVCSLILCLVSFDNEIHCVDCLSVNFCGKTSATSYKNEMRPEFSWT